MKKAKKIISIVMSVFTALIFVFGLSVFISVLSATGGHVPSFIGYSILQIQTGSMEPEYMTGSVIVVKSVDFADVNVGDVVSFYSSGEGINGKVNTHRVVEINKNRANQKVLVTKGDANAEADVGTVSSTFFIGKVIYNLGTVSGSVISVLRNPKIIFFLIVLPLIFITFGEAFNLVSMVVANKVAKQEETDNEESQDEKD